MKSVGNIFCEFFELKKKRVIVLNSGWVNNVRKDVYDSLKWGQIGSQMGGLFDPLSTILFQRS